MQQEEPVEYSPHRHVETVRLWDQRQEARTDGDER